MEKSQLPSFISKAFNRTKHPYLVWDGINEIPTEVNYLIDNYLQTSQINEIISLIKQYKTINLIGCGTSYFAAIAGSYYFNEFAKIKATYFDAFEFFAYPPADLSNDLLIAISHTGETASVINAVNVCREKGAKIIAITDVKDSPLAKLSDYTLLGMKEREPALPKTRSYEATLCKLLIMAILAGEAKGLDVQFYKSMLLQLPSLLIKNLNGYSAVEDISRRTQDIKNVFIVASGPNLATACEGALKFHECLQINAEAWELEEIMHGPWVAMKENDMLILLTFKGPSFEKACKFLDSIKNINPSIWVITDENEYFNDIENITILPNLYFNEYINTLFSIIPIYQYIYSFALQKKINPDVMKLYDENYLAVRLNLPR